MKKFFLIITGPTAVGKTALVRRLYGALPCEVINADSGQLYTPLTIGTAKPDWRKEEVPHHLFDRLDEPINFNAARYAHEVQQTMDGVWQRGNVPIVVGGSLFYLNSLFYAPVDLGVTRGSLPLEADERAWNWQRLNEVDPVRARLLHPHDVYRIRRALSMWYLYEVLPSSVEPKFKSIAPCHVIWCERNRAELYQRIHGRVEEMIEEGFFEEAWWLSEPWKQFVMRKNILGYKSALRFAHGEISYVNALGEIGQETKNYAKRQETFGRSWRDRLLMQAGEVSIDVLSLTKSDVGLYLDQLNKMVMKQVFS